MHDVTVQTKYKNKLLKDVFQNKLTNFEGRGGVVALGKKG